MSLTLLFKVAALLLVFGGATAAGQSPSASATLYPPSEPLPEPESGPSAVAESSRDQLWACEGFAASAVEWETADAQLRLVLDGHVLVERGFSANYWGATYSVSASTQPSDYDRTISCEIYVSNSCCGSASGSDTMTIFAELTPYVTPGSDTGNYLWNGIKRRDIWYQIWHAGTVQPWSRGGEIMETFLVQSNPCELEIQQGVGPVNASGQFLDTYYSDIVDPACATVARQQYRLSTSGYQMLLEQLWRWDTGGIWRQ